MDRDTVTVLVDSFVCEYQSFFCDFFKLDC